MSFFLNARKDGDMSIVFLKYIKPDFICNAVDRIMNNSI